MGVALLSNVKKQTYFINAHLPFPTCLLGTYIPSFVISTAVSTFPSHSSSAGKPAHPSPVLDALTRHTSPLSRPSDCENIFMWSSYYRPLFLTFMIKLMKFHDTYQIYVIKIFNWQQRPLTFWWWFRKEGAFFSTSEMNLVPPSLNRCCYLEIVAVKPRFPHISELFGIMFASCFPVRWITLPKQKKKQKKLLFKNKKQKVKKKKQKKKKKKQ